MTIEDARQRLCEAMLLLETRRDDYTPETNAICEAVHELVQFAWMKTGGFHAAPISENTNILVSTLISMNAILDAKRPTK